MPPGVTTSNVIKQYMQQDLLCFVQDVTTAQFYAAKRMAEATFH